MVVLLSQCATRWIIGALFRHAARRPCGAKTNNMSAGMPMAAANEWINDRLMR